MTHDTAVISPREAAHSDTEEAVLRIVREVLGKPALGVQDDMFDHGATSLSFVRVLAQIKQDFQVVVSATELNGDVSARSLAACVSKQTGK